MRLYADVWVAFPQNYRLSFKMEKLGTLLFIFIVRSQEHPSMERLQALCQGMLPSKIVDNCFGRILLICTVKNLVQLICTPSWSSDLHGHRTHSDSVCP